MKPLRVIAHLRTPMIGDHDMHLDGLLERAYCHRHGLEDAPHRDDDPDRLPLLPIPVVRLSVLGCTVPLASAWDLPLTARSASHHLTTRPDGEDVERRAKPFTPGAGPGRSRLIRREGVLTPRVEWVCVGDRREVLRLLRLIGQLGSMRRGGHGEVIEWGVLPWEGSAMDVLVADGQARRALPREWLQTAPAGFGAWRSPYWHPRRQVACALPGEAVQLRPEVVACCSRI